MTSLTSQWPWKKTMPPLSPSTTGVPAALLLYDTTMVMTTTPAAANATSGRHAVRACHSSGNASSATLRPNWGRVDTAAAARTPAPAADTHRCRAGALARPQQQPQRALTSARAGTSELK